MRLMHGLCLAVTVLGVSVQAGTIVETDSGNIGEFTMINAGINAGTATILVGVPSVTSSLNTVNGATVAPDLVTVNTPVTLLVTPVGSGLYSLALVPTHYTVTIGKTPGSTAVQEFTMTEGNTPAALPNFFNISGEITAMLANSNPNFDFSEFASGGGMINMTFTSATFGGGITSFADLFSTVGATAAGNGSFSEAGPVSEPRAIALLGIGIVAIMLCRLLRPRPAVGF